MRIDHKYKFRGKVWLYEAPSAAWHFVTVSKEQSAKIRLFEDDSKRGWGSIPVTATIGKTTWKTSIFPHQGDYILPLKADVRKKEKIAVDKTISVILQIGAK